MKRLTVEELATLALSAQGKSVKEIAKAQAKSPSCIKHRRLRIMDKLGAANMVEAVAMWMRKP